MAQVDEPVSPSARGGSYVTVSPVLSVVPADVSVFDAEDAALVVSFVVVGAEEDDVDPPSSDAEPTETVGPQLAAVTARRGPYLVDAVRDFTTDCPFVRRSS
jgi:hypothetical protein